MASIDTGLRAAGAAVLAALSSAVARVRRLLSWAWSLLAAGSARGRAVLDGPVRRALAGPVRAALFGRRTEVSLVVALFAPLLAAAAAWVIGGIGFETLLDWAEGTWDGTDPSSFVLLSAAALVALAAVSAAVNSGLVPTTLLVAGPVFGAAITRYGTTVERVYGTHVVSLPEAVGVAALLALAVGVPLALAGFVLGAAARRVVRTLTDGPAGSVGPERV